MTELRLASWNIRKCVGLDRRRDPARVARVLAGLDADVVALQEADRRIRRRPAALPNFLIEQETDLRPIDAGGHSGSLGWHGNAVLLKREVSCIERHSLHLPGLEPRGALIADLVREEMNFRIVAVHLGVLRRHRKKQLASIRAHLDTLSPLPTVIMGDFNEWSQFRGFEALDAFEVHSPGRTYHASRPIASLDRFAVNNGVAVASVSVVENSLTRVASDHLPISAQVRLNATQDFA
ncbi:MAG: endonuclease/exonuclease/phosphatase family protein [Boseongicola sp.]